MEISENSGFKQPFKIVNELDKIEKKPEELKDALELKQLLETIVSELSKIEKKPEELQDKEFSGHNKKRLEKLQEVVKKLPIKPTINDIKEVLAGASTNGWYNEDFTVIGGLSDIARNELKKSELKEKIKSFVNYAHEALKIKNAYGIGIEIEKILLKIEKEKLKQIEEEKKCEQIKM